MAASLVLLIFLAYLGILFGIAYVVENRRGNTGSPFRLPFSYALSLTVYCTAWTFLGSVGKAANDGLAFLPIYLGPLMLAPVWPLLIQKIIRISKAERLSSLADFLSSRYGKSRSLGVLAASFLVIGTIPYISIQLKAISTIFDLLTAEDYHSATRPFYSDSALLLTLLLAIFIGVFGVRRLDPNEKHEGIIAAVSFEAVFKLIAFLAVGIFVTYGLFDGPTDLFAQANAEGRLRRLFSFGGTGISGWDWFWLNLVSMCAVVLLPRQFHLAVVENETPEEVKRAAWFFPLYLLLINVFVLPIAVGGLLVFGEGGLLLADSFVISLPAQLGYPGLAVLAALGGFAAATGMVIMSTIALSLMITNNIVLPYLLEYENKKREVEDLSKPLLNIRRLIIVLVLLLAYAYYKGVSAQYSLVAIGLVSFTAVAQFAPSLLAALYWKTANRRGAMLGLIVGFSVWMYTLALPTQLMAGASDSSLLLEGPWGIRSLRPQALFGSEGMSPVAHSAFWSLLANTAALVVGSLSIKANALEVSQADFFVDHEKYLQYEYGYQTRKRQAKVSDLQLLLGRFTGHTKAQRMIKHFLAEEKNNRIHPEDASPQLFGFVEQQLVGAVGSASTQVLLKGISREEPIQLEEVVAILQRTQEAIRYGRVLEKKQSELEELTSRLRSANQRLEELDRLKADFVSTVTHELRTPITSIKSLARILLDTPNIQAEQQATFLRIIVSESERLARLVSQVLDLQQLEASSGQHKAQAVFLNQLLEESLLSLRVLASEKEIRLQLQLPDEEVWVLGPRDRLTQVVINLVGNAIKFAPTENGYIKVRLQVQPTSQQEPPLVLIRVQDNGPGIPKDKQDFIFGQFTQISDADMGKPAGSGLGLYISRRIVEQCGGGLHLDTEYHQGAGFVIRLPRYFPNGQPPNHQSYPETGEAQKNNTI